MEEHGCAFELAKEFSCWAFDGFDHGAVVFWVYADFEEPLSCLEVVGFVESDFSCAEFSEAEVEPCVFGSFFLEADFDAFQGLVCSCYGWLVFWYLGFLMFFVLIRWLVGAVGCGVLVAIFCFWMEFGVLVLVDVLWLIK